MLTAVTSFSPEGYEKYARRFIESFYYFWPKNIQLICAWEGEPPSIGLCGFDLLGADPARSFVARHRTDPIMHGLLDMYPARWTPKAKKEGYSFHHDAFKFARKVFAVCRVAKLIEQGKLFWLDADIVTHQPVTETFLHGLLPDNTSLCYLSRQPRFHSELGFVGYNLERQEVASFLAAYEDIYTSDEFQELVHWDDCSVFDHLVRMLEPVVKLIPHNSRHQPFEASPLGRCMTHLKGKRKDNEFAKAAERQYKLSARGYA